MGLSMLLVLTAITQDPIDAIGSFAMKVAQQLHFCLNVCYSFLVDGPSEI
jgi:hypothetical protein